MLPLIKRAASDRRGATMIEYSLIAALVAVVSVTVLATLGHTISGEFSKVNAEMKPVSASAT